MRLWWLLGWQGGEKRPFFFVLSGFLGWLLQYLCVLLTTFTNCWITILPNVLQSNNNNEEASSTVGHITTVLRYAEPSIRTQELKPTPSSKLPSSGKSQGIPFTSQTERKSLSFVLMKLKVQEVKATSKLTSNLVIISNSKPCPLTSRASQLSSPKWKSISSHQCSQSARETRDSGESSGPAENNWWSDNNSSSANFQHCREL